MVRLLVVDDSGFFRKRLTEILEATGDIEIVAAATNGQEAIDLVRRHKPQVITMDYEMPVMDGITAVREIMRVQPTPILMFSSLTHEGARVTLDALEAGAVDFLPKSFEDLTGSGEKIRKVLHDRILAVAGARSTATPKAKQPPPGATFARPVPKPAASASPAPARPLSPAGPVASTAKPASPAPARRMGGKRQWQLVVIGTSTGGPVALQQILTRLPGNFPLPLMLVQHMPATFTPAFAERLDRLSALTVRHLEDGMHLKPGHAYVAPGGKQTVIERHGSEPAVRIREGDDRLHYKPCIDVTLGSAAKTLGSHTLGIILTGMGADGREGCRMLRAAGGNVWAQDEQSSVIYGMPGAVFAAGLAEEVLALDQVADRLIEALA